MVNLNGLMVASITANGAMANKMVKVFLQIQKAKLRRAGGKMAKMLNGFEIY
jgi:hypothetical protein